MKQPWLRIDTDSVTGFLFFIIAKLMILLCRCVIQCLRKETKKEKENNDSEVGSQSEEDEKVCC